MNIYKRTKTVFEKTKEIFKSCKKSHVKISGDGTISTTSDYIVTTEQFKKDSQIMRKWRNENKI